MCPYIQVRKLLGLNIFFIHFALRRVGLLLLMAVNFSKGVRIMRAVLSKAGVYEVTWSHAELIKRQLNTTTPFGIIVIACNELKSRLTL